MSEFLVLNPLFDAVLVVPPVDLEFALCEKTGDN